MTDVICQHLFTGQILTVPDEMVSAYVPYPTGLLLEEAARIAVIRELDNAANFMASAFDTQAISEGPSMDNLAIESPTLR